MSRRARAASATALMLSTLVRSGPAFVYSSSHLRPLSSGSTAGCRSCGFATRGSAPLFLAKGFGETPKPTKPQTPDESNERRPAKSLMPLASAASKLLPKQEADGKVKFDNPAVGDFQVLDALVEYPGSFDLKIIGVDDESFVADIRTAVAGCLTKGDEGVLKCSTREKGKYTSITLKVHVDNSTQLYQCYEVINEDKRVKFKF